MRAQMWHDLNATCGLKHWLKRIRMFPWWREPWRNRTNFFPPLICHSCWEANTGSTPANERWLGQSRGSTQIPPIIFSILTILLLELFRSQVYNVSTVHRVRSVWLTEPSERASERDHCGCLCGQLSLLKTMKSADFAVSSLLKHITHVNDLPPISTRIIGAHRTFISRLFLHS